MKNLFVLGLFAILAFCISCSTSQLKDIQASLPDLRNKPDNVYRGFYDLSGTPVEVTVDVTVRNQKITELKIIKHKCSPVGKKAEKITDRIVESQSLNVDVVSGATGSSKAILKAVEVALQ